MDMTTISLDKTTRDELQSIKEKQELPHYDATIAWLVSEVDQ
jgi:hypothetical protein